MCQSPRGRDHGRARIDDVAGSRHAGEPIVVDDEPHDFAVDNADPARLELMVYEGFAAIHR